MRVARATNQKTGKEIVMFASRDDYENIEAAEAEFPGALAIVEVDGGWMIFHSASDYETWQGQE